MKKLVSILLVLILVVAVVPQTMSEDAEHCDHEWRNIVGEYGFEQHGSSGHIKYGVVYKFCDKCNTGYNLHKKAYIFGQTVTKHSYENVGGKFDESYVRINNAQHVYYYKQKVECWYCNYKTTLSFSRTENHTFKNGKCTKCGSKK